MQPRGGRTTTTTQTGTTTGGGCETKRGAVPMPRSTVVNGRAALQQELNADGLYPDSDEDFEPEGYESPREQGYEDGDGGMVDNRDDLALAFEQVWSSMKERRTRRGGEKKWVESSEPMPYTKAQQGWCGSVLTRLTMGSRGYYKDVAFESWTDALASSVSSTRVAYDAGVDFDLNPLQLLFQYCASSVKEDVRTSALTMLRLAYSALEVSRSVFPIPTNITI
jgi:hypothetical protein